VINFFIDRPIFSTVLAIIITLAGGVALSTLPVARFPQITPPTIVVSTAFPGADAATIEQSVAAPIEEQVNGVPHMIYMDSKSANDGSYALTVTFEVGTDQDIAAVDVQNQVAIAQRQLPQQVLQQGVTVAKRQPQILLAVAIGSDDPRYDYLFLSNYATLHVYDALAPGSGLAGAAGGVHLPGELARHLDPDAGDPGVSDRRVQCLRRAWLLAQYADPVRAGARDRLGGGRCHRRGRSRHRDHG
jgi:HAE1 family hydrophobic/amphiphilic exporter-1/multidrug efflux pump